MDKLVFGKYLPLNSPIHHLDPRAKIIAMFLLLSAIFIPAGWPGYAFIALLLLIAIKVAKLNYGFIFKAFRPLLFMMSFLLIVNILSIKEGSILITLPFVTIYTKAIVDTLYIVVRLILMIIVTTLLTVTTKPLDLTLGIEYLLGPFKKIGVPAHEIAMMISIALRFIPTIIEEALRIMNSQKSRGVDFEEGKLKEKVAAIVSLIVPLFSVAFQRADELANAMEARGYIPSHPRTRYKKLKYRFRDYFTVFGALGIVILMIGLALYK